MALFSPGVWCPAIIRPMLLFPFVSLLKGINSRTMRHTKPARRRGEFRQIQNKSRRNRALDLEYLFSLFTASRRWHKVKYPGRYFITDLCSCPTCCHISTLSLGELSTLKVYTDLGAMKGSSHKIMFIYCFPVKFPVMLRETTPHALRDFYAHKYIHQRSYYEYLFHSYARGWSLIKMPL